MKMANAPKWANQYGKPDLERLGLFLDMPYMNGKGYVFPKLTHDKGKSMLGDGPKIKTGKQDCYFDKEFKRLFEGEALKGARKIPPSKFKNVTTDAFMPAGVPKRHATPGDHHGTFGGKIDAFSNILRKRGPYKHEPGQFVTNPGKKGGPGYINICINKYPEHKADRYGAKLKPKEYGKLLNGPMRTVHFPKPYFQPNPFKDPDKMKPGPVYVRPQEKPVKVISPGIIMPTGPGKWPGGCHAGGFDKFPEYKPDKYITYYDLIKLQKHKGNVFYPQSMGEKTYYTTSVINENIRFKMNANNSSTYEPSFINHLVGPNFIR